MSNELLAAVTISRIEWISVALILLGLVCQLASRRLPPGLGTSIFVGAACVGIAISIYHRLAGVTPYFILILRFTVMISLTCALLGWAVAASASAKSDSHHASSSATFFAWSLVAGTTTAILVVFFLAFLTALRLPGGVAPIQGVTDAQGLVLLAGLLMAILLWMMRRFHPTQPVMMLWIAALIVWWSALMIPADPAYFDPQSTAKSAWMPHWWTWTLHLQSGLSLVVLIAAVIQDRRYRARRRSAWPGQLQDLLDPYSRWPGYIKTESIIAAAILILGVYQVVRPEPVNHASYLVAAVVTFNAAYSCLFMSYRRWSANTAGLGMALATLAIVLFAVWMATLFSDRESALQYPRLFTAVLFALAIMIALWRWLSDVWEQQLCDGRAWTTTGRMIPYSRRTSFMLTALAVLIAFQLALWPQAKHVTDDDNSLGRMIAGLASLGLLLLLSARGAVRDYSPPKATLCLTFLVAMALFVLIRMPTSSVRGWLMQHDAVVYGALALPILMAAEWLPTTRWKSFAGPLWLTALLILPAAALLQLLSPPLPADWVRPATLAILGAVYCFAGNRQHRRAFLVLGVVLLLAALTNMYHPYGRTIVTSMLG